MTELKEPTFGQAGAYLHIKERNRLRWRKGHKTKDQKKKKDYRYTSESEPGREGRIKTNRSCFAVIRECDGEDNRAMTVVTGIQFNQSQSLSVTADALLTDSGCPIALTPYSKPDQPTK